MSDIIVLLGSSREGRQGEKVAKWVEGELKKNDQFSVELIDVKDLELPFYDEPMPPMMAQGKYNNPKGTEWAARVAKADGFVIVTPEYNHSIPAVLKNAIDWVSYGWNYKPVSFVSYGYGSVAGARAVEHLRQIFGELRAMPLRDALHIPGIFQAFDDTGAPTNPKLADELQTVTAELTTVLDKLKS